MGESDFSRVYVLAVGVGGGGQKNVYSGAKCVLSKN